MPAFYLTFLAVLLAGIGARDQGIVAGLALRQGRRPGVLIVGIAAALLTALLAAYAARVMLVTLPPPARSILAAIALGMAGIESMILTARRSPKEPTNSLGALAIVLLAHQVTDAARFVVFGLAIGLAGPGPAGAAGTLGGTLLIAFAWARPHLLETAAARWTRRGAGAVLLGVALVLFLRRFDIL